jgi:multiple sugar transport system substrate-binding protein
MARNRIWLAAAVALPLGGALFAASASAEELKLWEHETSNQKELDFFARAIDQFNAAHPDTQIKRELIPEGSYTESIKAAATAGNLPCLMDMDQPTVPSFAWGGQVRELGPLLPAGFADSLTTGARGTYKGKLYSLGLWDVALTLLTRKSTLEKYGFRTATMEKPYTAEELAGMLAKVKASGDFPYAIDVNTGWTGEWWAYGYAPFLQSGGADLIDRSTYLTAEGVLNGPAAVKVATWFQKLFTEGYASTKSQEGDFLNKTVAFHYTGSWAYADAKKALGDDLVVMPVPDFGKGPKIGAASWQWGITTACPKPEAAAEFIKQIMSPDMIATASNATGLIPVSEAALPNSDYYKPGSEAEIFFKYSKAYAVIRPETPGYPFISSTFEKGFRDIMNGADVQTTLDAMVDKIEVDIEDNHGYGFK